MVDLHTHHQKKLTRADLHELIARAVYAPSGDNSQPWQFLIEDDEILLSNRAGADATQYNFREWGSYFAHGAVLENLVLLAGAQGQQADIELFPAVPHATARVTFRPSTSITSPLVAAIPQRATNRKSYTKTPLQAEHRAKLSAAVEGSGEVSLRLCERDDELDTLAVAVSVNERLIMENRTLHDFLFGMIRWTRAEEQRTPGLYLKTMELPPPVELLFRSVLRVWGIVRLLNAIGFSRFIPTQSAPVYRASSAFGAIIINNDTLTDFVRAGRTFQRLWLTATVCGMSIQPVTAIPYLAARIDYAEANAFSAKEQDLIREANTTIATAFKLQRGERIAMLFRVGYSDVPSATSSKAPPTILDQYPQ